MGLLSKMANWVGSCMADAKSGFGAGAKTISPDMQSWLTGMDVPDNDQGAKMVSPYTQSTWIYTAVSAMAEALAQVPFRISRTGADKARRIRAVRNSREPAHRDFCRRSLGENIVESGEVVDLFETPHPTMGRTLFWEQVVSWDALRGEVFILPLDGNDSPVDLSDRAPRISRLITLDTSMFWHKVIGFTLEGWRYTGSPQMSPLPSEWLLPGEVVHIRNVNPYLYWRGLSPLLVALLPAAADYAASMFMKGLLMNNADTGVIATTEQNLTKEQREQFMAALRERKRKAGTPDRPLFLSSGVKIEKPTISNVDMQFLETRRLLRQEIGAIYKVPESVMGFSESKTSALSGGGNALNEEKLTFIEQNIAPKCHRYETAVAPIVRSFGDDLVGWFDIESLPIMQEARRARVDSATKIFAIGVPLNDINKIYDLGFPEYSWGKKGYLPFNLQPADQMEAQPGSDQLPGEELPKEKPDAEDQEKSTPFGKLSQFLNGIESSEPVKTHNRKTTKELWRQHVQRRKKTVDLFQSKVSRVLNEFRKKALAKLASVHLEKTAAQRGLVDMIFSATDFGNELKMVLTQPLLGALQEGGEQMREELSIDDPWEMPPKAAQEYLHGRTQTILGVGGTVRDQLNTSLEAGVEQGEGHDELADRIRETFNRLVSGGDGMTVPESRRVARTEVNMAFNSARDQAMEDSGVEYKSWLSSHGPTVRDGHAAAEEDTMDEPIPMDDAFEVMNPEGQMEQMMFPGDDSLGASAGNIVNCQCIQLAAKKTQEDGKTVTYLVLGLGLRTFDKKLEAKA